MKSILSELKKSGGWRAAITTFSVLVALPAAAGPHGSSPAVQGPPAGQELGPGANAGAPPGASVPPGGGASAAVASSATAPVVKVSALEPLNGSSQAVSADRSRGSDMLSADGLHSVRLVKTNLSAWTVEMDGKPGPIFPRITALSPKEDFSEVLYQAESGAGQTSLVIQKPDGTAKAYAEKYYTRSTATSHDPSDYWEVYLKESLKYGRLIRRHVFDVPHKGQRFEYQVDENGPVLGLFDAYAGVDFDEHGHYLARGLMPGAKGSAEPAVFLDGKRICQDVLPSQVPSKSFFVASRLLGDSAGYLLRLRLPTEDIDIVNGRKVSFLPSELSEMHVRASADGRHVLVLRDVPEGYGLFLDGQQVCTRPKQAEMRDLQITGDGLGLVYILSDHQQNVLYLDGQPTDVSGRISHLRAGPRKGQFACIVESGSNPPQLVLNRRRLPFASTEGSGAASACTPSTSWWSVDGEHLYGWGKNPSGRFAVFADNSVVTAEFNGKPFNPTKLLKPVFTPPNQVTVIAALQPDSRLAPALCRIQVAFPDARLAVPQ